MLALLGRPSGTIAVSTGMVAATTGRHGENPPRSSAIVVMAARRKRWTVGLVPRGLQAGMVAGAGQIRKNWTSCPRPSSNGERPRAGGQPRAAHVSHVYGVQSRLTSGGYCR